MAFDLRSQTAMVEQLPSLATREPVHPSSWCSGTSADDLWVFPIRDDNDLVVVVSTDSGASFLVTGGRAIG